MLTTPKRGLFRPHPSTVRKGPRESSPRASQRCKRDLLATTWRHLAATEGADGWTDGADGRRTVHVDSMVDAALAVPDGLPMAAVMVGAAPLFAAAVHRGAGEWQRTLFSMDSTANAQQSVYLLMLHGTANSAPAHCGEVRLAAHGAAQYAGLRPSSGCGQSRASNYTFLSTRRNHRTRWDS